MIRHVISASKVSIAGVLVDAASRHPVAGAVARIISGPTAWQNQLTQARQQVGAAWEGLAERLDRTVCAPDGWFYFNKLPEGDYQLSFVLEGGKHLYGPTERSFTVPRPPEANGALADVVPMPPTGISGHVIRSSDKAAIRLARISVDTLRQSAHSDELGAFYITGVEPGTHSIRISANGYVSLHVALKVEAGEVTPMQALELVWGEGIDEPAPPHAELGFPSQEKDTPPAPPPNAIVTPPAPAPAPAPVEPPKPTPERLDYTPPEPPPSPPQPRAPEPFEASAPPDRRTTITLTTGFTALDLRVPLWDWHEESSISTIVHTLRYLQQAIERMTGAVLDWHASEGPSQSGLCLVLWEHAGALQQDEDVRSALAKSLTDPLAAAEAFYIRTEKARVLVVANTPDGLCAGVAALLDSVGYEVLGMGPNWTHVPDFRNTPLVFNLTTAQRPSFYLRRLEPAFGQGHGKGTLADTVPLRAPDESTVKSYRRWLIGTRSYGRSTNFGYADAALDAPGKTPKTEHRVLSHAASHDFGFEGVAPRWDTSPPAIAQDVHKAYEERGIRAFAGQIDLNFGKLGLTYYLFTKMLWDVTRTADDLVVAREHWLSLAFGAGAGKMKEYYDLLQASGLTASGPGPDVFARAVQLIDEAYTAAAGQNPGSAATLQATARIDDVKLIWYFHYCCDVKTEETWFFLWKCQTSYMIATHPVAMLHWGSEDIAAVVEKVQAGTSDGAAHYTVDQTKSWWPTVKLHWSAPATPTLFTQATLSDGTTPGKDVDLNDLVAVRDFQRAARSDEPFLFQLSVLHYGRAHIGVLQVAAKAGDTLGFRLVWWTDNSRVDQIQMEVRFGIDRWDPATRLWATIVECERRMSEPLEQLWHPYPTSIYQAIDVRLPAPGPGTYRFRIGAGGCSSYLGSQGYEPKFYAYSDVLPFTFSDANSGYTQPEAYIYIPKGATKLSVKAADANIKSLNIMKAFPDGTLKEFKTYEIKADTTELNIPEDQTGSLASIRGDGFRLPRMYSIPTRWAKGPRALLIPRQIAEADKLTIIQPSTAKVDAFHAASIAVPPPPTIDVNDLVLVQEFQLKVFNPTDNDRPYDFDKSYRPPAGYVLAHYAGEVIGFSQSWAGQDIPQPYGIERWDSTNKVWTLILDITKTTQKTVQNSKNNQPLWVATVEFIAPAPGTYRFTLGRGGGGALASLAYDHIKGEYIDRRGLTYFGPRNPGYTGLYVYIPKDTPFLELTQVEESGTPKEVQLYFGTPASGLRPTRKIDISAIKAHSIPLERYETGTVAYIGHFYRTPLITSVPNIWAKRPSALAIPRQTAEKDGLTILGTPKPVSALAFSGDTSVLTFPDPTKLANPASQTIEMWVRREASQDYRSLYIKRDDVEGRLGVSPDGKIVFACGDATGSNPERPTSLGLPTNEWVHVVAVTDREKSEVRIYGNGTLRYSGYLKTGLVDPLHANKYTSVPALLGKDFCGSLCEVRIWKVARTPEQIAWTWNRRLTPAEFAAQKASLMAYLPMNGTPDKQAARELVSLAEIPFISGKWAADGPTLCPTLFQPDL